MSHKAPIEVLAAVERARRKTQTGYYSEVAMRTTRFTGSHVKEHCRCGAVHHHDCPECGTLTSGTGLSLCGPHDEEDQ